MGDDVDLWWRSSEIGYSPTTRPTAASWPPARRSSPTSGAEPLVRLTHRPARARRAASRGRARAPARLFPMSHDASPRSPIPTRRRILAALQDGARPVGELVAELEVSQPTVSRAPQGAA
ncbi:ArsR family transcriptional regulator [Kocuria rhizophila]|nr:ArsR family transcriptional regulator [Kocuria rhizophila]